MNVLDQVKLICKQYEIRPSKNKGQNFMISLDVIDQMIATAEIEAHDEVLEIGPGLGILTQELLKKAKRVVSVELDENLFNFLKAKFAGNESLTLVSGDALTFAAEKFFERQYRVVANLPYNITSHFLKLYLTRQQRPSAMTLMLQKEVAERICAPAGAMSLLSLSVQLYAEPRVVARVGKEHFWPMPDIDSAIIHIDKIKNDQEVSDRLRGVDESLFWRLARIGFSAKRKKLANNLANGLHVSTEQSAQLLKRAEIDGEIRAQNLTIDDWISLALAVDK